MILCKLLLTLVLFGTATSQSFQCGPAETWSDCVSPCNTCKELGRCELPPYCQSGCDCKYGFFRSDAGRCVPHQHCQDQSFRCPANSIFLPCGPACPPTCDNIYGDEECQEECSPGCHCRPGFVKRRDGRCVHPNRCYSREGPETCKEGERYYECTPSCKNMCENFNNPGVRCQCGPPGCFCKEGLVKRADGKCVQPLHCSRIKPPQPAAKCPPNAIFIECGSPCPPTCDDLTPQPCEQRCVSGCYCKPGYLKRSDEKCVLQHQCIMSETPIAPAPTLPPRRCPENAMFIECGSACPPTCSNRYPELCGGKCVAGCFCKPGYLWQGEEGKCVPRNQCEVRSYTALPVSLPSHPVTPIVPVKDYDCPANSEYLACGSACAPNCEKPTMEACREPCVAGCFCKPGYLKDSRGICVLPANCDSRCFNVNEEFLECGTACPDTCDNRGQQDLSACTKNCVRGCFCKKGLFRSRDGRCVYLQDCPPRYTSRTSTTSTTTQAPYTIPRIGASSPPSTIVDYSRGCPNRNQCDAFCRSRGIFRGVCIGQRRTTCRCI